MVLRLLHSSISSCSRILSPDRGNSSGLLVALKHLKVPMTELWLHIQGFWKGWMAHTKNLTIKVTGKSLNWPRNCFLISWDKVKQEPSIMEKLKHLGSLHRASSTRRERFQTKTRGKASFKVKTDIKTGTALSHTSNPWWVTHSEAMEDSAKKGHLDRPIWEEMVDMNLTNASITTNNQT